MPIGAQPTSFRSDPAGCGSTATTYQSFALWAVFARRPKAVRWSATVAVPEGAPAAASWTKRRSFRCPSGAPTRCGRLLSTTTAPVSASTTRSSYLPAVAAARRRKDSIVTSKWTIAAAGEPVPGTGVEFEMTHSFVSGDTYGFA